MAGGGGACEELDAVHTLVMMSLVTKYRDTDIFAALRKCSDAILLSQQRDGGFRNYNTPQEMWLRKLLRSSRMDWLLLRRRMLAPEWRYSGWKPLSCPPRKSDVWAAWFRPLSVKLIADRYPDKFALNNNRGKYRRIPGLGWHDPLKIETSRRS